MKSAAISTMHLYGIGGGARTVAWFARALGDLEYRVDIYSSTPIPPEVRDWLPHNIAISNSYPTCARGYDLLLNIDHFGYVTPLAERNWAHIFQPHDRNRPPDGFELWANSKYTAGQCRKQWGLEAKYIYVPMSAEFRPMRKQRWICHCSRFVQPTPYADKGHRQMIMAFISGFEQGDLRDWRFHLVGPVDPGMDDYFRQLQAMAQGYPIHFHLKVPDSQLVAIVGQSAIYWQVTGITMKEIPGAQEHLGATPIEAMAAGTVPICHNTGGHLETIRQGQTGFLVNSTRQLLETTVSLSRNWHMWAAVSEQAHRQGIAWQDYFSFVDRMEAMLSGESREVPHPPILLSPFHEGDVSIIIPVRNKWKLTERMLGSIMATCKPGAVFVVDNASTDETPARASESEGVTYIRLAENKGYAGAIMEVLPQVKTPLVLLANNDMECLDKQWLAHLTSFMSCEVGIVGPKLLYHNGTLQFAGGLFDWNRPDVGYHRWYGEADGPKANLVERVPFVTGACLLARKELLGLPSGLREGLNYEDAHWCLNAWYRGYEVVYVPCVRLMHYEAQTKLDVIDWARSKVEKSRDCFAAHWHLKWLSDSRLARVRVLNTQLTGQ